MPQGDKSSYSSKQKRQAEHIEESYEKKGASTKKAERIAWATVNKQDGGAKGPDAAKSHSSSSKSGKSRTTASTKSHAKMSKR